MKRALIAGIIAALLIPTKAYALDFMYADDIYTMAEEISKPYNISPELVQAIIWTESRYATDAVNKNCKGLMQVNEKCHKDRMDRLGVTDLYNPYDNIRVGVDYLSELYMMYEDTGVVLDMYNGLSVSSNKVSAYTKQITELAYDLETEHGKHKERRETK